MVSSINVRAVAASKLDNPGQPVLRNVYLQHITAFEVSGSITPVKDASLYVPLSELEVTLSPVACGMNVGDDTALDIVPPYKSVDFKETFVVQTSVATAALRNKWALIAFLYRKTFSTKMEIPSYLMDGNSHHRFPRFMDHDANTGYYISRQTPAPFQENVDRYRDCDDDVVSKFFVRQLFSNGDFRIYLAGPFIYLYHSQLEYIIENPNKKPWLVLYIGMFKATTLESTIDALVDDAERAANVITAAVGDALVLNSTCNIDITGLLKHTHYSTHAEGGGSSRGDNSVITLMPPAEDHGRNTVIYLDSSRYAWFNTRATEKAHKQREEAQKAHDMANSAVSEV